MTNGDLITAVFEPLVRLYGSEIASLATSLIQDFIYTYGWLNVDEGEA